MPRLKVTVEGQELVGLDIKNTPTNSEELIEVLQELLSFINSPVVPDNVDPVGWDGHY